MAAFDSGSAAVLPPASGAPGIALDDRAIDRVLAGTSWRDVRRALFEHAVVWLRVAEDKADDLAQDAMVEIIDASRRRWDTRLEPDLVDHLRGRMEVLARRERRKKMNRFTKATAPEHPLWLVTFDANAITPERHAVLRDMGPRLVARLHEKLAQKNQDVAIRVLELREKDIVERPEQAKLLGVPLKDVHNAHKHIFALQTEVFAEFGGKTLRNALVGAAPRRLIGPGWFWTRLFIGSYVASGLAFVAGMVAGHPLAGFVTAAAFALLEAFFWLAWLRTCWQNVPFDFRFDRDARWMIRPNRTVLLLLAFPYNLWWLFVAAPGLCDALDRWLLVHKRNAPRTLVVTACALSLCPGPNVVFAPLLWALAMRAIDEKMPPRM